MIGVLAALAVPSISYQMKSNRTYRAAQEVALLYRQARVRAMGRGSAVLFRFTRDAGANGRVELREAVQRIDQDCHTPRSSCQQTDWITDDTETAQNQLLSAFNAGRGLYDGISLSLEQNGKDEAGAEAALTLNFGEFCFTPLGRVYFRANSTSLFSPLPNQSTTSSSIRVDRTDGVSFPRRVMLPTNGAASVVAVQP